MANIASSLSTSENASSLLQSVVSYVKDTQATSLNLHRYLSILRSEVDIQPIFNSIVDSHITEVTFSGNWRVSELCDFLHVLNETKIERLDLSVRIHNEDRNLSAILKNTRITQFEASLEAEVGLDDGLLDELIGYLKNSRIRSFKIFEKKTQALNPMFVISRILSATNITHLQYAVEDWDVSYSPKPALNLQLIPLIDLNLKDACIDDSMAKVIGAALENSILEKLTLARNKLTDVGVDSLVPGLIQSKISYLDLSFNKISGRNTLLQSLKNTKILTLDLAGNNFFHDVLHMNRDFLKGSSVVTLCLSLSFKEAVLASRFLPAAFIRDLHFSDLTHLNLGRNDLRSGDIEALAGILSRTNLTYLNIERSKLSERCFSILGEGLRQSKVRYINLRRTDLILKPVEAVSGVASLLQRTKGSELLSVDIELHDLWKEYAIFLLALRNLTLIKLKVSSCDDPLPEAAVAGLAQQLKSTSITSLDLRSQEMEKECIAILAKHLVETQIVKLDLSDCLVNSCEAKALASVLKRTKLRSLDLRDNKFGKDGEESLAKGAENTCITYLDVSQFPYTPTITPIDRVMWENRRKVRQFADLLTRSPTGKNCLLDFDRDFNDDQPGADLFVKNCLDLCKFVSQEPYIVGAIEQDKLMSKLEKAVHPEDHHLLIYGNPIDDLVFIADCELIYEKIMAQPSPVQDASGKVKDVNFFKKQALWFILEHLPTTLASVSNRAKLLFNGLKYTLQGIEVYYSKD